MGGSGTVVIVIVTKSFRNLYSINCFPNRYKAAKTNFKNVLLTLSKCEIRREILNLEKKENPSSFTFDEEKEVFCHLICDSTFFFLKPLKCQDFHLFRTQVTQRSMGRNPPR